MPKNFLRQIREQKNIGQAELAQKIGVSKQLLSGFENGRSGVSHQVIRKIAELLQITPDQIFSGNNPSYFNEKQKKRLSSAMNIAFKFYGDELEKDIIVRVATELYSMNVDYELLSEDNDKQAFMRGLEEKIITGLAAKCLINQNQK